MKFIVDVLVTVIVTELERAEQLVSIILIRSATEFEEIDTKPTLKSSIKGAVVLLTTGSDGLEPTRCGTAGIS